MLQKLIATGKRAVTSVLSSHSIWIGSIFVIWLIIVTAAYQSGTWLSGWDNLHPEFDFWLNVRRSLFSVWQEYQGLGLLGGMSHAADLPRQLLLWLASLLFPREILRFGWTSAMLLLGPLGVFALLHTLLPHPKGLSAKAASTIAAGFYLLNLGTVQHFYVPYEAFSSFYGWLPWLLWALLRFYKRNTRLNAALLFAITWIASPSFYVQTLFVVFGIIAMIFSAEYAVKFPKKIHNVLIAGLVVLAANSYWLLPSMYFSLTHAEVTVNAKINTLSTPEVQLMNRSFGSLQDMAILKGFWFEYTDYDVASANYSYLMKDWREVVEQPAFVYIGYSLFAIAAIGVLLQVRSNTNYKASPLMLLLICLIMLSSGSGWLGFVFNGLSDTIPLFGQMFRSPFTKWVVAAELAYAIGLALFTYQLIRFISQHFKKELVFSLTTTGVFLAVLLYQMQPLLQGKVFYSQMQAAIPQPYFQLFEFMKLQPKQERVAVLPDQHFWAWSFHEWGYRGSGFIWYGIEQPIVDRAFDYWSQTNETLYLQLSRALQEKDADKLKSVIDAHQLSFILIDESRVQPEKTNTESYYHSAQTLLQESGAQLVFSQDFLSLYSVDTAQMRNGFVSPLQQYSLTETNAQLSQIDSAFLIESDYLSPTESNHKEAGVYPFSYVTQEQPSDIKYADGALSFSADRTINELLLKNSHQLSLEPLATGSSYLQQATFLLEDGRLTIAFPQPMVAIETPITTTYQPLPYLETIVIPVDEVFDDAVVQIGGTQVEVKKSQELSLPAELTVGQETTVTLFNKTDIVTSGQNNQVLKSRTLSFVQPTTMWNAFTNPFTLKLPEDITGLSVQVTTKPIVVPLDLITTQNCDVFDRGSTKQILRDTSITFEASDWATACSSYLATNTNSGIDYLLKSDISQQNGRGMKTYVIEQNESSATLEVLAQQSSQVSYATLLSSGLKSNEYSLHWETRSFGDEASDTLVSSSLFAVPLRQISSLKLEPTAQINGLRAEIETTDTYKFETFFYSLAYDSENAKGAITLSQSFDEGWLALAKPTNSSWLSTDYQLLDHTKYNGWANAWFVPEGEYQVIIFYWPQLLGFTGYAVTITTFLGLVLYLRKPTPRP